MLQENVTATISLSVRTVYTELHKEIPYFLTLFVYVRVKSIPLRPGQSLRFPGARGFQDNRPMKVLRFSAYSPAAFTPGNIDGTYFRYRLSQPKGHSAAGRIMAIKNYNVTVGNWNRELPTCSSVPQPTVLPPVPKHNLILLLNNNKTTHISVRTLS
jgi:hypothetical protein